MSHILTIDINIHGIRRPQRTVAIFALHFLGKRNVFKMRSSQRGMPPLNGK